MKLRVSLKSDSSLPGRHRYDNQVNAENYKDVALVLLDLANHGVPLEKAIKEYFKLIKSDWEAIIGV
jgi:hypothetical protein